MIRIKIKLKIKIIIMIRIKYNNSNNNGNNNHDNNNENNDSNNYILIINMAIIRSLLLMFCLCVWLLRLKLLSFISIINNYLIMITFLLSIFIIQKQEIAYPCIIIYVYIYIYIYMELEETDQLEYLDCVRIQITHTNM